MTQAKEGSRPLQDIPNEVTASRRARFALAVLLTGVPVISAIALFRFDPAAFLYNGDAASHMVKARLLVDSQHPWFDYIGTVWLPLPHILLTPFVAFDSLFFSGLAGVCVGIPCLVGTGLLLYSIVERLTRSSAAAFVGSCIFCLNPNVMYLALTPMTELPMFLLIVLGAYALLRWLQRDGDTWLAVCAVAAATATLCRYEAWLLAGGISLLALLEAFSAWRRADRKRAGSMVLIALLCGSGILLWLFWNQYIYADALQFVPWKYRPGPSDVRNPMYYRQEAVSLTVARALLNLFGPAVLLAFVAGLIWWRRVLTDRRLMLLGAYLALPALFIVLAILSDYVLIDQWWWNWRFLLTAGPFLAAGSGIALAQAFRYVQGRVTRVGLILAMLAMPVVQLTVPSVGVATYEDSAKIFSGLSHFAAKFGARLGSEYKGGRVVLFTGSGLGERIMVSSGIPLRNFHLIPFLGGMDIQGPIRAGDRYVVIGKVRLPDSREVVDYWLARKELMQEFYDIVYEDDNYLLLSSKTSFKK